MPYLIDRQLKDVGNTVFSRNGQEILMRNVVHTTITGKGISLQILSKRRDCQKFLDGRSPWELQMTREKNRPKALASPVYKSSVIWKSLERNKIPKHRYYSESLKIDAFKGYDDEYNAKNQIDEFEARLIKRDPIYATARLLIETPLNTETTKTELDDSNDLWLNKDDYSTINRKLWGTGCKRISNENSLEAIVT